MGHGGVGSRQLVGGIVRLHAQNGEDLPHNLAGRGGHHVAAGGVGPRGTAGGVHGQQHDVLRIVRRGKAHKGHHDVALGIGGGFGSGFVGGAGLSADAVAVHLPVFPGALRHHVLQALPDLGGGLLADHLADALGLMLAQDVPLPVQHLLHHIGLVEVAAVDTGRLGPDQLDGGDVEGLAEGVGGQGDDVGIEALFVRKDALGLADHVHAGLFHQAEGLEVFVKLAGAQGLADFDEGRVAGVAHRLFQNLVAVAGLPGAVEGLIPALDHDGAGALIGGVHVDDPLLQRRRQGDGLEGGAGLVGGVDALVPPLALAGVVLGLGHRLFIGAYPLFPVVLYARLLSRGGLRGVLRRVFVPVLLNVLQLLIQLGFQFPVVEDAGLVGIVIGIGRHAQEGPGIHIHHNPGAAVGGVEFAEHGLHALFQGDLDVDVQGQHQVAAVLRVEVLLILEQQGLALVVLG